MNKEEEYIVSESPEISVGEQPWARYIFIAFPALKHRDYQLYFIGQLISLIGFWIQTVAQGWLVLQLTHSAFWVGFVSGLSSLPILIFALFGGVIVDRFPKKRVLLFTQTSAMIVALSLGLLTVFNLITLFSICVLALLLGVVSALDMPARQAFAIEMVGKKDLSSAIALNSGIFNGARVIGPAIAGFVIAQLGIGGAFLLNGVSYIAMVIALWCMRVVEIPSHSHMHPLAAIKEGLVYSFSHNIIRTLLIFAGAASIFGWSYTAIMPVIAHDIFHTDAAGLGYLYVASGIGALCATVLLSYFSGRVAPLLFVIGGNMLFAITTLLFTVTTNFAVACFFLFFAGAGLIMEFATINAMIQHSVPNNLRGRVLSIYALMFLGMMPVGSIQIGILSEYLGPMVAVQINVGIVLVCGIYLLTKRKELMRAYTHHGENIT